VAGPWPIFTAFQYPVPVQLSKASLSSARHCVNQHQPTTVTKMHKMLGHSEKKNQ
jgi:hypothetical protein